MLAQALTKVCPICKAEYSGGEVFCPVDAARLSTPSQLTSAGAVESGDPLVGTTLNERYLILHQIGEGGMGIVYEAQHVVIEKRVALKVLRADFSSQSEVVQRFRQEAKSASRIGHEHIVDISDFGETPTGQCYFVMEYLEGEDLANVLAREGTVAPARAADLVLQCARALGAAHSKGIVHRDMKPENIFLTHREANEDFVKIVDFGIAKMSDVETPGAPGRKLTKTGMIFGTPEYMSPEQAGGKELDHRVDIYALGVILYEMVTGRVPFVGDSFMGILTQHMFETPLPLRKVNPQVEVSSELDAVIFRALAKDPDERYQTMEELAEAIAAVSVFTSERTLVGFGDPVKVLRTSARLESSPTVAEELKPMHRKGRGRAVALGGVLVAAALGVGGWLVLRAPAESTPGSVTAAPSRPVPPAHAAAPPSSPDPPDPHSGAATTPTNVQAANVPPAAPTTVVVSVQTHPAGARIDVEGKGEVCHATPCSFDTAPNVPLVLHARHGRFAGTMNVLPKQNTTAEIPLTPVRAAGHTGRSHHGGSHHGNDGLGADGLKHPALFQNQH